MVRIDIDNNRLWIYIVDTKHGSQKSKGVLCLAQELENSTPEQVNKRMEELAGVVVESIILLTKRLYILQHSNLSSIFTWHNQLNEFYEMLGKKLSTYPKIICDPIYLQGVSYEHQISLFKNCINIEFTAVSAWCDLVGAHPKAIKHLLEQNKFPNGIYLYDMKIDDDNIAPVLQIVNHPSTNFTCIRQYSSFDLIRQICETISLHGHGGSNLQIMPHSSEDIQKIINIQKENFNYSTIIFAKFQDSIVVNKFRQMHRYKSQDMDVYSAENAELDEIKYQVYKNFLIPCDNNGLIKASNQFADTYPERREDLEKYLQKNWATLKVDNLLQNASTQDKEMFIKFFIAHSNSEHLEKKFTQLSIADNTSKQQDSNQIDSSSSKPQYNIEQQDSEQQQMNNADNQNNYPKDVEMVGTD